MLIRVSLEEYRKMINDARFKISNLEVLPHHSTTYNFPDGSSLEALHSHHVAIVSGKALSCVITAV